MRCSEHDQIFVSGSEARQLLRTIIEPVRIMNTDDDNEDAQSHLVGTISVNLVNKIPVLVLHVLKANIPENTSIVNEDIDPAKVLDSRVDNGFTVLDTVVVGSSLASGSFNFIDHDIGSLYQAKSMSVTTLAKYRQDLEM